MSTCRLDRSRGDGHRRLSQNRQHVGGRETANTSAFQDPGDARLTDAHSPCQGVGHELPQIKEPFGAQFLFEFEHGGKITPQLLAQTVAEPIALGVEIVGHARPFTQLDRQRLSKSKLAEVRLTNARFGPHGEWYRGNLAGSACSPRGFAWPDPSELRTSVAGFDGDEGKSNFARTMTTFALGRALRGGTRRPMRTYVGRKVLPT